MGMKYTLKTERIEFGEDDWIEVRGLGLPDIMQLFDANGDSVQAVYDKFVGLDPNSISEEAAADPLALAGSLAQMFPALIAHVIALAADVTDSLYHVSKLPIDVQAAALEKIFKLTFAMSGGPKKFLETVVRMAGSVSGLNKELSLPLLSQNGFGASEPR